MNAPVGDQSKCLMMKPRLLCSFVAALSCGWMAFSDTACADYTILDSVEQYTALADHIGIYSAERIYGPHTVTNRDGGQIAGLCTIDFSLEGAIQGSPPEKFSRSYPPGRNMPYSIQDFAGFHLSNNYVFFFTTTEFPPEGDFSERGSVFEYTDYIALDPPYRFLAIDHRGTVLTNRLAILNLITNSLSLPQTAESVEINLPTPFSRGVLAEKFIYFPSYLLIPRCLFAD